MDSLDESPEDTASCASTRASGSPLAKLSEVGYCRDGVPTTVVSTKDERDDTVTRSVAKVILGSSKTRRVILTKRPTSFWA